MRKQASPLKKTSTPAKSGPHEKCERLLAVERAGRVRAEQKAAALAVAIDAIPHGVYIGDAQGVNSWNKAALDMLGAPALEDLQRPVAEWSSRFRVRYQRDGPLMDAAALPFARALNGERASMEMWAARANGKDIFMRSTAAPIVVDRRIVGAVAVSFDLTERLHLEQERDALTRARAALRERDQQLRGLLRGAQAARADAESASQAKDEFLATVSHELRTPLTAILGWATVLEHGIADAQKLKLGLATIARNARAQARLIEDLLDMNRMQSGLIKLELQPTDPVGFMASAVQGILPAASAKGVEVRTLFEPAAGMVSGDANRLHQVVWNLLGNAVKFTPAGGSVTVRLSRHDEILEIGVDDTGRGIEPDFLPRMFDRFQQQDATSTRRHGGLGIGLSMVRHLVELHGGTVQAYSRGAGQGATFTVRLPAAQLAPAKPPAVRTAPPSPEPGKAEPHNDGSLGGVTVLLIDDEPDVREVAAHVLAQAGARVLSAASAREGFELFRRYRPHVLLSDIAMPGHDGYDLLRWIRALDASEGGSTPAAAITAFTRSGDVGRTLAAGFQAHLAKPLEPAELVSTVANLVKRKPT